MIWTLAFWKGLAERAIKTGAQTLAAYFVIGTTSLLDLDWVTALSVSGAAMVASALTSLGNADFVAGVKEVPDGDGKHRAVALETAPIYPLVDDGHTEVDVQR